jgi:hypothetical protein
VVGKSSGFWGIKPCCLLKVNFHLTKRRYIAEDIDLHRSERI